MKKSLTYNILRILTGLGFAAFGIMKFFPMAAQSISPGADAFFAGMAASGYFIPFLGIAELVVGLMFLFNFRSALAAIMMFPISLNIVLFDLFLAPGASKIIGLIVLVLNVYLLCANKERYESILAK